MTNIQFILPDVSTTILREIFENDAYTADDSNDYDVVGHMTKMKDGKYKIVYHTICFKRAVYDGVQWSQATQVKSKPYYLTVEANSPVDSFIQCNDEYDGYDDCDETSTVPERPFEIY